MDDYYIVNVSTYPEETVVGKLIHCRDCRYFSELIPGTIPVCLKYGDFTENEYCSKGKRRDA